MADDNNLNLQELTDDAAAAAEPTAAPAPDPNTAAAQPNDGGEETEIVRTARDLESGFEIPEKVSAALGKATLQVNQLLQLGRGAVVELDRKVGEAVDIYVNNRLVARGEVVIVDERLGVTMTEIIKGDSK